MKSLLTLSALLALSLSSFAALSPYNDTLVQFQAVLGSGELERQIHAGRITAVKNVGYLTFEVDTASCQATVVLDAHGQNPPTMPGGVSYTLKSVDAKCK